MLVALRFSFTWLETGSELHQQTYMLFAAPWPSTKAQSSFVPFVRMATAAQRRLLSSQVDPLAPFLTDPQAILCWKFSCEMGSSHRRDSVGKGEISTRGAKMLLKPCTTSDFESSTYEICQPPSAMCR